MIELMSAVPYGMEIMTTIGTLTTLCTIIHPFAKWFVAVTPWQWDDDALTKASKGFKAISKFTGFFKRFSLIK
jgi:hypothetical protein